MAVNERRTFYYQYGAEAPNYPMDLPERHNTPNDPPLRRQAVKTKPKFDFVYFLKMSFCGIGIFSCAFSFVHLTATLSEKQSQLKRITTQIRETQSAINSVQAIISANLDLESIQTIAQTQLQMAEPLPHQVIYLELPQESYTQYHE